MLNYETLLSSYDDKLTLMQWLKKVEKALAGASASSFEVIKTGNATIRFRINFEDGTYLESGDIVLQQGESVSSGEIRNGHLYLTLTNGQELDCGELFNGEVPSLEVRSLEVTGGLIVGDDANVAIGGDLVVHGLTEVQNLLAYGHVETETLTAAGDKINAEKPVIEVMTGYSFDTTGSSSFVQFPIYAGICKNGNKLTFVLFTRINFTEPPEHDYGYFGKFTIPVEVANKIYTYTIAGQNVVVNGKATAFNTRSTGVELVYSMRKYSGGLIYYYIEAGASSLSLNTDYFIRLETTLLLSDNLAA